jgi:hypothetical protein
MSYLCNKFTPKLNNLEKQTFVISVSVDEGFRSGLAGGSQEVSVKTKAKTTSP